MRIIGGRMRGRRLTVPEVPGLRPTPDRVRETLFNWLGQDLDGEYPEPFVQRFPDLKGLVKILRPRPSGTLV